MEDRRKVLYDRLHKEYDLGDFESFSQALNDEKVRKNFYNVVSERYDIGDYDTFVSEIDRKPQVKEVDDLFDENMKLAQQGLPTKRVTTQSIIDAHPELGLGEKSYQYKPEVQQHIIDNKPDMFKSGKGVSLMDAPLDVDSSTPELSGEKFGARVDVMKRNLQDAEVQKGWNRADVTRLSASVDADLADIEEKIETRTRALRGTPGARDDRGLAEYRGERSYLEGAKELMEESQKLVNAAKDAKDGTVVGGVLRGTRDKAFDVDTWTMGISDLVGGLRLKRVLEDFESGKELTPAQDKLLNAAVVNMTTTALLDSDLGGAYKAGQVTGESLPFMLEMMVNPVSASGNALAKRLLNAGLKKFAKNKAAKIGARLAGDALAATGMAATTGVPGVFSDTVDRLNKNYKYGLDPDGNLYVEKKGDTSFGEALGRSFTTRAIENQSEMIFNAFKGVGGMMKGVQDVLPGGVNKFFDMLKNNKAADAYRWLKKSPVFRNYLVKDVRNAAQIGGIFEEYAEEVYNNLANFAIGEMSWDDVVSLDKNIDTFLGLAPTQVMFGLLGLGGAGAMRYQTRRTLEDLQATMNEQQRKQLEGLLDMGLDAEEVDVRGFIRNVMQNENYTVDNKRDMIKAAFYVAKQNGIDQLTEADVIDKVDAENSLIDSVTDPSTGVYAEITAKLPDAKEGTVEVPGYVVGWFGKGEKRQPIFVAEGMDNTEENRRVLKPGEWDAAAVQEMPAEQVKTVNEEMIREEAAAQAELESKYAPEVLNAQMQQGVPFNTPTSQIVPVSPMPEGNGWIVEEYAMDTDNKVAKQPIIRELTNEEYRDMLQAQLDAEQAAAEQVVEPSESVGEQVNSEVNTEVNNPETSGENVSPVEAQQPQVEAQQAPVIPTKEDGSIDFVTYGKEGSFKTLGERYGEKMPNKVAVTAKALADDLKKAQDKLSKAEEAYDNAPIGREDKAKNALDKAQQELDAIKREADFWAEMDSDIKAAQAEREAILNQRVEVDSSNEPMTADEFVAQQLASGNIILNKDDYMRETGFGSEEANAMNGGAKKLLGAEGMTIQEAGERLMEMDRENGTNFFDQSDSNAGRDALISVLGSVKSRKELNQYIANNRVEQAKRDSGGLRSEAEKAVMDANFSSLEDFVLQMEAAEVENPFMEDRADEIMAIFAEEAAKYEQSLNNTENEQGRTNEVAEGSDTILSEEQSDDTGGTEERSESERVGDGIVEEGESAHVGGQADEVELTQQEGETILQFAERVAEENRRRPLRKRAKQWSDKLGVKVRIMESLNDVANPYARRAIASGQVVTGWFEESTGKVCIYMPHINSGSEVDATYIHEVVAHKGLRGLLGEKFDSFCDEVWYMMSDADRLKFMSYPGVSHLEGKEKSRAAADEYIAHLAENVDVTESAWSKLAELVKRLFKAIGIEPKMTNADIANTIKKSYQRLLSGENAEGNVSGEGTRFRFSKTPQEFDAFQKEAVGKKGIVMPGLNEAVVDVLGIEKHDFKGSLKQAREEAKQWAIENYQGKEFSLPDNGGSYTIGKKAVNKYVDKTSINKSDNAMIHLSALKELPNIISSSITGEIHADYKKDENGQRSADNGVGDKGLLVHRMFGAVGLDGKVYRVKTTMNEYRDPMANNTPHSYEVTEIELIESSSTPSLKDDSKPVNVSNNSITGTKLLNGVEKSYDKGKKLLSESEKTRFRVTKEEQAIIDKAKADGTYMKAPNGKPTNLNEKQWVQVRTKAFKKWFGDWEKKPKKSSLMVDENGEPKVFYHGSPNEFNEFLSDKMGMTGTSYGQGFYFSPDKEFAEYYKRESGRLYELFINMRKPLSDTKKTIRRNDIRRLIDDIDKRMKERDDDGIGILDNWDDVETYGRTRVLNKAVEAVDDYNDNDVEIVGDLINTSGSYDTVVESLRETLGYDGIIPSNTDKEIIVHHSNQIKSAISNEGAFDSENNDIRFRFIGERGARNLDKAEEANTRLDNLAVAREMEEAEKDAKAIKTATGWERGADGKWRYEVKDHFDVDAIERFVRGAYGKTFGAKVPLERVLKEDDTLLTEYPQLKETSVKFQRLGDSWGVYYPESNEIVINNNFIREEREISDRLERQKELVDQWKKPEESKKIMDMIKVLELNPEEELKDSEEKLVGIEGELEFFKNQMRERIETTIIHEIQHAIQHIEGFEHGGNVDSAKKEMASIVKELGLPSNTTLGMLKQGFNEGYATAEQVEKANKVAEKRGFKDIESYLNSLNPERFYNNLSGEVEARNAARRSRSMTEEDMREYLASETEDVAREDQIFLNGALGEGTRFRVSNQNQEIFVSNAQRAVESIKQEKGTPQQWLAMIEKNSGLKAGEDKWLGLSDWLKGSEKKSLTKAEILDYIGENKIVIEEVRYGKAMFSPNSIVNLESDIKRGISRGNSIEDVLKSWDDEFNDNKFDSYKKGLFTVDENGSIKVEGGLSFPINNTRIHYTTEGLENKKEIALTVPTIETWNEFDEIHFGDAGKGRAVAWIRFGETTTPNVAFINARYAVNNYIAEMREKYNVKGGGIYDVMNEDEVKHLQELTSAEFDTRGKVERVLVIDEIQSKRHQEGRERGYMPIGIRNVQLRMQEIEERLEELGRIESESDYGLTDEQLDEQAALLAEERELVKSGTIPAAPFEKNWHELAMKRMLRYAAENGFDKVAWTTGAQQAERYNIGGVVSSINYYLRGDGAYRVETYGSNGYQIESIPTEFKDVQALADVFGKELATKMVKDLEEDRVKEEEAKKSKKEIRAKMRELDDESAEYESLLEEFGKYDSVQDTINAGHEISGDGLRVGGEGMKGFYDRMLPSFVNKYVKKWGTKVQDIELPNVEEAGRIMHSVDVTDAMKESVMEGQTMFRIVGEPAVDYISRTAGDDVVDVPRNEVKYTMNNIGAELYKVSGDYMRELYKDGVLGRVLRGEYAEIDQIKAKEDYDKAKKHLGEYLNELIWMKYQATEAAQDVINDVIRDVEYSLDYYRDLALGNDVWRTKQSPRFRIVEKKKEAIQQEVDKFTSKYNSKDVVIVDSEMTDGELEEAIPFSSAKRTREEISIGYPGGYSPNTDKIYIFVDNQELEDSENTMFHENLHPLFNNSAMVEEFYGNAKEDKKALIEALSEAYNESEIPNEMFAHMIARDLSKGNYKFADKYLSEESRNELFNTLKEFGYDRSEEESIRRGQGNVRGNIQMDKKPQKAEQVDGGLREGKESAASQGKQAERLGDLFGQVADMGLDGVLGNKEYTRLMVDIYKELPEDVRTSLADDALRHYGGSIAPAVSDYLNIEGKANLWDKIAGFIREALRKVGVDVNLNANDAKYILWRSRKPLDRNNLLDMAEDIDMRYRLKVGEYSPTDGGDTPGGGGTRFRVTHKMDAEYLEAVNNGDMEKAQKMVLEAAKMAMPNTKVVDENGDPKVVYHGTSNGKFNVFDKERIGEKWNADEVGFFFTDSEAIGKEYTSPYPRSTGNPHLFNVYLNIEKPLLINSRWYRRAYGRNISKYDAIEVWDNNQDEILESYNKGNFDGVIIDTTGMGMKQPMMMVAFEPSQIKSAEPVTYDDNGNLIPLSERFNSDNNDIRFRVSGKLNIRDKYEATIKKGSYQAREAVQDNMLSLRRVQELIEKASGKKLRDFENAWMHENRLSSVVQSAIHEMERKYYKPMTEAVKKLMDAANLEQEQVADYLILKHGIERNREMAVRKALTDSEGKIDRQKLEQWYQDKRNVRNRQATPHLDTWRKQQEELDYIALMYGADMSRDYSGLTSMFDTDDLADCTERAYDEVEALENAHPAETEALGKAIKVMTQNTLDESFGSGLMNKVVYEELSNDMYDYYIPLRGFEETTSDEVYAYMDNDRDAFNAPLVRAKGRSSKSDNPLAYLKSIAESGIMQGERNKMKQTFLNMVTNHPSDLVSVREGVWVIFNPATGEWEAASFPESLVPRNATPADVDAAYQQWEADMEQRAQQDPNVKKVSEAADVPYRVIGNRMNQHQVIVKRLGKSYTLTINGNPRLAMALNGLTNPNNTSNDGKVSAFVQQKVDALNRNLSAWYTTRNPDFVASNFMRDTFYTNTIVRAKEGNNYANHFHAHYAKLLMPGRMISLFSKYENGTLDLSKPVERDFHEFMMNGGETGYSNLKDLEHIKKQIAKDVKGGRLEDVKGFLDKLDLVNRAVENTARFAAYRTSRQQGRSVERSIFDAKEISVNFNKKGAGGTFFGATGQTGFGNLAAMVGAGGRAMYVFFNAAIQGTTNLLHVMKVNPAGTGAGLAAMFLMGAVIPMLLGGDDEKDYYDLPEHVRRNHLILPGAGDSWISIPLPIEYRIMYGMGELLTSWRTGHERGSNIGMKMLSLTGQALPLNFLEEGVDAFMPSALSPLWQVYNNQSWTGLPIYKDNEFNKDNPEYTKAYKNVNRGLYKFTKALYRWTFDEENQREGINLNPAVIEHIAKGYFGGLVTTLDNVWKTGEMVLSDREFDWRNIPVGNRIFKTGDERTKDKRIQNEYFENVDKLEFMQSRERLLRKTKDGAGVPEADKLEADEDYKILIGSDVYKKYVTDPNGFKAKKKAADKLYRQRKEQGDSEKIERDYYKALEEANKAVR